VAEFDKAIKNAQRTYDENVGIDDEKAEVARENVENWTADRDQMIEYLIADNNQTTLLSRITNTLPCLPVDTTFQNHPRQLWPNNLKTNASSIIFVWKSRSPKIICCARLIVISIWALCENS
jgi:hypothetical protein